MTDLLAHQRITAAISATRESGRVALVPFITAGYPDKDRFIATLQEIASVADVVEIGVPFSDPLADGVTIQRASRVAIENGVSLGWILAQLEAAGPFDTPLVLMSYLNPLYVFGYEQLAVSAARAGACGFIVPDLPIDEADELSMPLEAHGLGIIHLVAPTTPNDRVLRLCAASRGFIYAVTMTGITGGSASLPAALPDYLDELRSLANIPVCAGFGVRNASQVEMLARHADGVIVGSALVEQLEQHKDPVAFLRSLRP